ncbi:hypothetical protein FRC08_016866 [Ceratobasidium sp. 394]|nr:hypothetical protein FRC08_016866 [Ceratobasidium sp. 394]
MLDLHEAMRGLRFAPDPLLVLDSNRHVRVVSRPAERLFGVSAGDVVGRSTDHLWAVEGESRQGFMLALNEAAQRAGGAGGDVVIRRLKAGRTWVDMSVAAWHPTDDPMYTSAKSPVSANSAPRTIMIHECFYTISLRDVGRKATSVGTVRRKDLAQAELSSSTLDIPSQTSFATHMPTPPGPETSSSAPPLRASDSPSRLSSSPSPPPHCIADILRDGVIDALDTAVFALSADGTVGVRNQQCIDVLGLRGEEAGVVFFDKEDKEGEVESALSAVDGGENVDRYFTKDPTSQDRPSDSVPPRPQVQTSPCPSPPLSQTSDSPFQTPLVLTNLSFSHRLTTTQHPLYRAAILGQVVHQFKCGGVRQDGSSDGFLQGSRRASAAGLEAETNARRDEGSPGSSSGDGDGSTVQAFSPAMTFTSLPSTQDSIPTSEDDSLPVAPTDDTPKTTSDTRTTNSITFPSYEQEEPAPLTGTRLILELSARPMRDARGELVGGVMTIRDVTQCERERVESVRAESDMREYSVCDLISRFAFC